MAENAPPPPGANKREGGPRRNRLQQLDPQIEARAGVSFVREEARQNEEHLVRRRQSGLRHRQMRPSRRIESARQNRQPGGRGCGTKEEFHANRTGANVYSTSLGGHTCPLAGPPPPRPQ